MQCIKDYSKGVTRTKVETFHTLFWEIQAALNEIKLQRIDLTAEQENRRISVSVFLNIIIKVYFINQIS